MNVDAFEGEESNTLCLCNVLCQVMCFVGYAAVCHEVKVKVKVKVKEAG